MQPSFNLWIQLFLQFRNVFFYYIFEYFSFLQQPHLDTYSYVTIIIFLIKFSTLTFSLAFCESFPMPDIPHVIWIFNSVSLHLNDQNIILSSIWAMFPLMVFLLIVIFFPRLHINTFPILTRIIYPKFISSNIYSLSFACHVSPLMTQKLFTNPLLVSCFEAVLLKPMICLKQAGMGWYIFLGSPRWFPEYD